MNRKLLQDQPLKLEFEDLESVNYLDKQDKKNQDLSSKRNDSDVERTLLPAYDQIDTRQRLMAHNLQVLDIDTENFKNRLEDMVNKFKNDTLNEFIAMKRSILKDQQEAIESETHKYTRVLESRNNELDSIKLGLAKKIKQQERSETIIDVLSERYGESRRRQRNAAMIARCFAQFKLNRDRTQMKKKMNNVAEKFAEKMNVRKLFGAWKSLHVGNLEKIIRASVDDQHNKDISTIASKFNKEIELLTEKLKETTEQLDQATRTKTDMQDNLKKAFMRGVCALNFEAMSVLQTNNQAKQHSNQASAEKAAGKEASAQQMKLTSKFYDEIELNKENLSNPLNNSSLNENKKKLSFSLQGSPGMTQPHSTSFESKEVRWKDPPVVGAFSVLKSELNQPQQQTIKIRDVIRKSPISSQKENSCAHYEEQETEEEGKVIRVNAGKSYASTKKENSIGTIAQSLAGKKSKASANTTLTTNVTKKR